MIRIMYANRRYSPILVCDICGQRIEDGAMAAALTGDMTQEEGSLTDVLHVHKGSCHTQAERTIESTLAEPDVVGWQELGAHLSSLIHNVGFKPKDLEDYETDL